MKKILFVLAAAVSCCMFAQENLLINGGFEKISKTPKASDKYTMNLTKRGWDLGIGPVAKLPSGWVPNINEGKVKIQVVTVGEDGKNKEHVAEGKNSVRFIGKGFHMYNHANLKPGKYKFSLKYKGTGRVTLCFYSYRTDPKTRRGVHVTSTAPMTMMAKPEWQTYTREIVIGKWNPTIERCTFALTGKDVDVYIDDVSAVAVPEK